MEIVNNTNTTSWRDQTGNNLLLALYSNPRPLYPPIKGKFVVTE